jgi:hypothetical protein
VGRGRLSRDGVPGTLVDGADGADRGGADPCRWLLELPGRGRGPPGVSGRGGVALARGCSGGSGVGRGRSGRADCGRGVGAEWAV